MSRWMGLLLGVAVVGACSNERRFSEAALCAVHLDCRRGEICGEQGRCVGVEALAITTESLPNAVVGSGYSHELMVGGGATPYLFLLSTSSDGLSWLSIESTTGRLSGTPVAATSSPLALEVRVTDTTGLEAVRSFELAIEGCDDGDSVACFAAQGERCMAGTAVCEDGLPNGDCEVAQPSDAIGHCGAECGACHPVRANQCVDGQCRCGQGQGCAAGQTCCGQGDEARCVQTATDSEHCGGCGQACEGSADAPESCQDGVCVPGSCATGLQPCDSSRPGVCTTDTGSDVSHCGACGNNCSARAADRCAAGECVCANDGVACLGNEQCCAGVSAGAAAGCADLDTGARVSNGIARCGACDAEPCPDPQGHGAATCIGGRCGARCDESEGSIWTDCGVAAGEHPADCSVDLLSDPGNCGACGNACPVATDPAERALCLAGQCAIRCVSGTRDCLGLVPRICNADGVWELGQECVYACELAECLPQCSPEGVTTCIAGVRNRCSAAGEWAAEPCAAGTECSGSGVCLKRDGQPCTTPAECASGACVTRYVDADRDAFGGAAASVCGATPPVGFAAAGGDCCDSDANARPTQTDFFPVARTGCGGYDYDCANGEEVRYSETSYYCLNDGCQPVCNGRPSGCHVGWNGSVPACGTPSSWSATCVAGPCPPIATCCTVHPIHSESRTQECR